MLLSGCAGAPVRVGDNHVEKSLQEVTGLTTADVENAVQKQALNLWDVYALAVKHTEDLANKVESIEQSNAQSAQAVASVLPQISLNDTKNWQSSDYIYGFASPFSVPLDNEIYLSASETILSGLNQVAALQGAQAQVAQNQHLLKQEGRNLLLSVARTFYAVLQAQDALESNQEIEKLDEEILKQEQQWHAMGRSRDSDVLTVEAQLAQTRGNIESLQGQMNIAKDNLVVLADWKASIPLKSEEQSGTPSYSFEEAEAKVDQRSDVMAAKAAVDVADAALLQAHGGHLPTVSLQGNYYLQQDGGGFNPTWNIKLNASLPIFDGGNIFAEEDSAASKKRQAEYQYTLTRRQALQDIRGAYKALATSALALDAYNTALNAARKDYQAVEHDRKLALNTNLDVLQSLTQLQTAELNYQQTHYQNLVDWIWLGVATGDLPKLPKKND